MYSRGICALVRTAMSVGDEVFTLLRRAGMSLRTNNFVLVTVCLCIAASAAYCAPTIGSQKEALSSGPSTLDNSAELVYPIGDNLGSVNNPLGELGSQLLNPPASIKSLAELTTGNPVKSLPAVPAAVFMVLSGFACVSLVKDRRFWMAALAAVFWVGQTGLANLPRLAQRLAHSNREHSAKESKYICLFDDSSRLRSDLEGTEYIGLLHHLGGIPDNNLHSLLNQLPYSPAFDSRQMPLSKQTGVVVQKHTTLLAALCERQRIFNSLFKCLDFNARQHISFSPAFIFNSLSRGPPRSASMNFHTVGV